VGIALGKGPVAITKADFNRDGSDDLAIANQLDDKVSVVTNLDTTSPTSTTLNVCDGPQAVVTADFNDDDAPDLAVACFDPTNLRTSSAVQIFINGSLTLKQTLSFTAGEIGLGPISLATADFDNDACPDLAVANSESNSVVILKGTCQVGAPGKMPFLAGIFTPIEFDNAPWSLKSADFNRDGDPDLAVVMRYSDNVRIFLGTGAGGFIEKPRVPTCSQPVSVAVGDFNADAIADLAVACFESANVNLYRGRGDGEFDFVTTVPNPITVSANVTDVVAGKILSGPEDPTPIGKDRCDDIAFLVAPNTPVPPNNGTVVVQPLRCRP